MRRTQQITQLAALLSFEIGAIVVLHRLGRLTWMTVPWGALDTWLELAPIEDVTAALLRTIALGVAYWIAMSTGAYALARVTRLPGLIKATAWATLPPIRRVIDRAIAVTVTTAALAAPVAPALADEVPAPTPPVIYQISDEGVPTPINPPQPIAVSPPGVVGGGYTPRPAGGVATGAETASFVPESRYEVVKGDNLWKISAGHLAMAFPDRAVPSSEVAVYWRTVIELNTPTLRSGDPNLIYPGEQIVLPAIELGGST